MEQQTNIQDSNASNRKQDHIQLAFQAQVSTQQIDDRFYYEPLLAAHPNKNLTSKRFLNKTIQTPIWVSSMTGGTEKAYQINHNLAQACAHFKMGMSLGSCRSLLDSNDRLPDFDLRKILGDDVPFYANLGIAQIEILLDQNNVHKITELIDKLQADGLIVHINPLQEWLQPEGDKIKYPPIDTLKRLIDVLKTNIIVKEVGQGFGKRSLKELLELPIQAIEFAAHGGTNFSKLELLRNQTEKQSLYDSIANIGHSATEMVSFINDILKENNGTLQQDKEFIISGGIKNFLDGYYLMSKLHANSIYGQASTLLKYAEQSYDALHQYLDAQIEGLKLAQAFLKAK
ncbi:MAG: type 2 isopentenyl-diphosphate Delta-isomerase [Sphingobacteriales bacterium]|nr:MAG: type 2 isopentenyl-diphosphate Delta-isomerase [Sphingobacteriales bacterium]